MDQLNVFLLWGGLPLVLGAGHHIHDQGDETDDCHPQEVNDVGLHAKGGVFTKKNNHQNSVTGKNICQRYMFLPLLLMSDSNS